LGAALIVGGDVKMTQSQPVRETLENLANLRDNDHVIRWRALV
jgi:hypothetical protein